MRRPSLYASWNLMSGELIKISRSRSSIICIVFSSSSNVEDPPDVAVDMFAPALDLSALSFFFLPDLVTNRPYRFEPERRRFAWSIGTGSVAEFAEIAAATLLSRLPPLARFSRARRFSISLRYCAFHFSSWNFSESISAEVSDYLSIHLSIFLLLLVEINKSLKSKNNKSKK